MSELRAFLIDRFRRSHRTLLAMVDGLTEEQYAWRPTPSAHNIAFQVWHLARTADDIQATLRQASPSARAVLGAGEQIWFAESLARRWGLNPAELGAGESGYEMDDAAAARLRFPPKAEVVGYMRRAFEALEQALEAVQEDWTAFRYTHWGDDAPLWQQAVDYLTHHDWNAGYIAALRRAQGLPRVVA
ncbi:MAG: DinB family protein [Armatimonadota bacterium]|nr:DinB family protein [Armatimonadota bacterium]MDR7448921.1 DinB family protein [Armatimonadota bacterium]MDR7491037.1 DinB family protein [Armatimonadota bacterium]MDR7502435.1 DinB family protein [Armatimonadota bacterium]MDR7528480.1 DinB family protein [Armatimonadota bacterium]